MPICAVLVPANGDKIEHSVSVRSLDDIEIILSHEATDDEYICYIWMVKTEIRLCENWSMVGSASKYDGDWRVHKQYGVWACLYQKEVPQKFKKNPLDGFSIKLDDRKNKKTKPLKILDKSFQVFPQELSIKKKLRKCSVELVPIERTDLFVGCVTKTINLP